MRFRTTILQAGKTATGIEVPAELVESLRAGKRAKIRVTINGYTYRSSVAPLGGVFMVGVSAEPEPRVLSLPADFEAALDAEPGARQRFDALSFSNQQRLVLPIEDAKTPETRQRRIDKAIGSVRGR